MYRINLLFNVSEPLTAGQRLGLMQMLQDAGWGKGPGLEHMEDVTVTENEQGLTIEGYGQKINISLSDIKPLHVVSPWKENWEPMQGYSCIRGSADELSKTIEYLDRADEFPQILINGTPYQCIPLSIEYLLEVLQDPDSPYPFELNKVYRFREGELYQQVAERTYQLELLGPIR
jgi:hypothetical protein